MEILPQRFNRVSSSIQPCLIAALLLFFTPSLTQSHPAHAKPVNYPFVVGFERFHSSLDDDDYLAEGGMILLNELNCVACHAPPASHSARLTGVTGTNLEGVASRLQPVDLEMMIRNPRFLKRDTTMPGLFSGPDRNLDEVTALTHFLASKTYSLPDYPTGDVDRGRKIYHRIGCVACHAPEVGYRPDHLSESTVVELAGLPSVPMNLADLYSEKTLTHFLLNPHQHRPSGRMPEFGLTVAEASDIAAYLKAGPGRELPQNLTEALDSGVDFKIDPAKAALGKELFVSKQCTACHELPGTKAPTRKAAPLAKLSTEGNPGCLSERPVGGAVPYYGLDTVQKRAISNAIARIGEKPEWNPLTKLDWRLMSLNCYACHERAGKGGPEYAREIYFSGTGENIHDLGRWGNMPPTLESVGAKLTDSWFKKILLSRDREREVRPYMVTRMPLFREDDMKPLIRQFRGLDSLPPLKKTGKGASTTGENLIKDCQQCHPVGGESSKNLPGINLALAPERLRDGWFAALLKNPQHFHPGTPMPVAFPDSENPEADIHALLDYLKSIRRD